MGVDEAESAAVQIDIHRDPSSTGDNRIEYAGGNDKVVFEHTSSNVGEGEVVAVACQDDDAVGEAEVLQAIGKEAGHFNVDATEDPQHLIVEIACLKFFAQDLMEINENSGGGRNWTVAGVLDAPQCDFL